MAGFGNRFKEAGYDTIKPMINVSGTPMFVRAVNDLPKASHYTFIIQKAHSKTFDMTGAIKYYFPDSQIVTLHKPTQGQACTVLKAKPFVDLNQQVLVGACDNSHLYNTQLFNKTLTNPTIDCSIWTYRGEPRVAVKPEQYGWVQTQKETSRVDYVSCKKPISKHPLNDHAVSGCFYFKQSGVMFDAIETLMNHDLRTNNEYYMDTVPNILIKHKLNVQCFEVEKYIGWGTPQDLEEYHKWCKYVNLQNKSSQRAHYVGH